MSSTQSVISAPPDAAARRMPAALIAGSAEVVLERDGTAPRWQWRSGGSGGTVAVSALTSTTSLLHVTAERGTPAAVADALTVELYGALEASWAPAVPRASAGAMGLRSKLAFAAAVVLIPLLALTGMRLFAPPKAVDVAAAVTQFREQGEAPADGAEPAAQERGKAQRPVDGSGTADAGAARQQVSAGSPRGNDGRRQEQASQRGEKREDRTGGNDSTTTSTASTRDSGGRQQQQEEQSREKTASGVPEEGVYRYATEGYESIDRPSARHDYPSETAMSIRANNCGFTGRWQPLENRWDEMTVCRQGGNSFLPRLSTHREFYGQENDSNYRCNNGNYAYQPQPGATWTGTCADGSAKMDIRGRTIGREVVRVGDEAVETVHYTVQARIYGGDAEGTWLAERWVDPDTGVLVRVEAKTDATSDSSVGKVRYREELSLRLLSMQPER